MENQKKTTGNTGSKLTEMMGWTKPKGARKAHENFPSFFTYDRKKIFDGSARFMQF